MTARALVVAPDDGSASATGRASRSTSPSTDGPSARSRRSAIIDARFVKDLGTLAQLPGTSFYRRLREKFGRLAS